jgi:hypothetical protein
MPLLERFRTMSGPNLRKYFGRSTDQYGCISRRTISLVINALQTTRHSIFFFTHFPALSALRRAIAKVKQSKFYYLELLRALAPTPVSRRVDVRQAAGRRNNCRIFITT